VNGLKLKLGELDNDWDGEDDCLLSIDISIKGNRLIYFFQIFQRCMGNLHLYFILSLFFLGISRLFITFDWGWHLTFILQEMWILTSLSFNYHC
jgi:hypothetical protein